MHKTLKNAGRGVVLLAAILAAHSANAEIGMGIRAGTLGGGLDLNIGMTESLALRLGYNYLSYDQTVEDTDVRYDGTLDISSFSALLDWHVAGSGFRLTLGAVSNGPKIEVDGTPTSGTYTIGNNTYTASQVGSLRGEIKIGNSVAPYVGLGYGNVVSEKHRVTFLFDLGAIYGGTPDVSLTAECGAPIINTPACTQLQNDTRAEVEELKNEASTVEWYPVINIGLGIRF